MSDQAMFSQLYNALVDNLGTPNFQLLGTPKDFSWGTAPTGQWDPAAYQIVSGMPQWSAIGQYGSLDATLFDAVRQIFGHVTFKVSPEQQANQAELANLWAAAGLVDTDLSFLSLLELYGTEISERRMPTRRVVEALDVVEHI